MSGYAVSARLHGGTTRFVAAVPVRIGPSSPAAAPPDSPDLDRSDPVGRPLRDALAERWDDLRETWSQTTFYLFDPESWR